MVLLDGALAGMSTEETTSERLAVVETRVAYVEQDVQALEVDMVEAKLIQRELKTNWRLAIGLGGLAGTLFVGLMLLIATSPT